MKKLFLLLGLSLGLTSLVVSAKTVVPDIIPIPSNWDLFLAGNSCLEHYQFRSNGDVLIKSNLQRLSGKYYIVSNDRRAELPAVVIHFEQDNQQLDCSGNKLNQVGTTTINFMKKVSDQQIYFCIDAFGKNCPVYLKPEHSN